MTERLNDSKKKLLIRELLCSLSFLNVALLYKVSPLTEGRLHLKLKHNGPYLSLHVEKLLGFKRRVSIDRKVS